MRTTKNVKKNIPNFLQSRGKKPLDSKPRENKENFGLLNNYQDIKRGQRGDFFLP